MTAETSYDKLNEHRRAFDVLPNVLIQDPARSCAYFIKSEELTEYRSTPATWSRLDDSTVSFVIPDGEVIDEVPSFLRNPEIDPSVLIRYSRGQASYFLRFEDLQKFEVSQPTESLDTTDSISFIVPRGTELIEELPTLRRALLQSHTQ
ncbi:MAG: hypothetical protein FWE35_02350 [Streptosporangiales bacterium]|jgi:hypothetical protein|nr:hypothetical protein [Streptosporangiales bacterium]